MTKPPRKSALLALWFVPIAIVVAIFFAIMPWARQQNPAIVQALSLVFVVFVFGHSLYIGHRMTRGLDEVQIAQTRFAHSNGWVWGGFGAIVLMMLPPVMNALIDFVNALVNTQASVSPFLTNRRLVTSAFILGGTLVMVVQGLASVIAAVVWQRRMGRVGEPS